MSASSEWCKINTENFALVFYPGFGQVLKSFKFGPDQTMLIRLIRLKCMRNDFSLLISLLQSEDKAQINIFQ